MEAFHVVATHPQLLPGIGDANSQYDVWGNFSRAITANGTPSPHLSWKPTEQEMLDAMVNSQLDEPPLAEIGSGLTARSMAASGGREILRPALGSQVDELSDAEVVDSFYYTVFPNFHPWGAYNRIVYRFRPNGTDVDQSDHGVYVSRALSTGRETALGSDPHAQARTTTGARRLN